jgi:hypothetical protein
MGIGTSVLLIAIGAVLDFGISVTDTHGFNIHDIGIILMVVGAIGVLLSLLFWGSWGGFGGHRREVVERDAAGGRRRVLEEERF